MKTVNFIIAQIVGDVWDIPLLTIKLISRDSEGLVRRSLLERCYMLVNTASKNLLLSAISRHIDRLMEFFARGSKF